jgi:hypothetical protein
MARRVLGLTLLVIGMALAGQYIVTAQQASRPQAPTSPAEMSKMPLVAVTVVQIKPELVDEWMEFQKKETMPTLQKGGVKDRSAFVTAVGPTFEYAFLTPMANFAARDGDNPILKALGQDGARAYGQKSRRFINSQRTYVVVSRTDLTYIPDSNAKLPIAVISDFSIANGRAADFENYIKTDLTAAHKQLKTGGFAVYQGLFGGDGNTFVIATLLHNFAELDQGPAIRRAFGEARAATIQQKLGGVVTHVERTLSREVTELSFHSKTTS